MFKYSFLIIFSFSSLVSMEPTPEQAQVKAKKEKLDREIAEFPSKPKSAQEIAAFASKKADELASLNQQQRKANNDAVARGLASIDKLIKEQRQKNEHAIAIGAMLEDATTPDEFDAIVNQMVSPTANKLQ